MTQRRLALLEALAGIAVLSVMDAMIKGLADRYPTFQLAFARYLFGGLVIAISLAVVRPARPSWETLRANGLRALLVVVTAVTFFYALGTLPLAETLAISFVSPIFIVVFGATLLREPIGARILAGLALGFLGMAVVVAGQIGGGAPESGERSLLGIAAILVSALTYALSMVLLRSRAQRDPVITIVAIQNIGPGFLLGLPAAVVWRAPPLPDWALLATVGTLGVAGHLLLGRAYSRSEAARLAVLEYTALIWAVLIGFVAFAEVPGLTTILGAVLIMGGSMLASRA